MSFNGGIFSRIVSRMMKLTRMALNRTQFVGKTLSRTTLSKMTFGRMSFSRTNIIEMTLSRMTLKRRTFRRTTFNMSVNKIYILENCTTTLSITTLT